MSAPGRKGETVWALTGRRFLKHRLAVISLGMLAVCQKSPARQTMINSRAGAITRDGKTNLIRSLRPFPLAARRQSPPIKPKTLPQKRVPNITLLAKLTLWRVVSP